VIYSFLQFPAEYLLALLGSKFGSEFFPLQIHTCKWMLWLSSGIMMIYLMIYNMHKGFYLFPCFFPKALELWEFVKLVVLFIF